METITDLAKYIDHSLLKPTATYQDIERICNEAIEYGFYSVCINPFHVRRVREILKDSEVKICTVVGFPLGANTLKSKLIEATTAQMDGAHELDIVWNLGAFKSGDYVYVEEEIRTLVCYTESCIHKIIVETAYLTDEEKIKAVEIVVNSGAEFIKTSTGFAPEGAKVEDVKLFKELAGNKVKIKAAGGIRDYETALKMIKAGADRLGTSHSLEIIKKAD